MSALKGVFEPLKSILSKLDVIPLAVEGYIPRDSHNSYTPYGKIDVNEKKQLIEEYTLKNKEIDRALGSIIGMGIADWAGVYIFFIFLFFFSFLVLIWKI